VHVSRIAAVAGMSVTTSKKRMTEMCERGELVGFRAGPIYLIPFWVITDSPEADEEIETMLRYGCVLDDVSRAAREKAGLPTGPRCAPPNSPACERK
jgi:hypothetical protein